MTSIPGPQLARARPLGFVSVSRSAPLRARLGTTPHEPELQNDAVSAASNRLRSIHMSAKKAEPQ